MASPEPSIVRKSRTAAKRMSNGSTFKERVITFGGGQLKQLQNEFGRRECATQTAIKEKAVASC